MSWQRTMKRNKEQLVIKQRHNANDPKDLLAWERLRTKPNRKWLIDGWMGFQVKNVSSQLTHCQLTLRLTESSFWGNLFKSQWTHTMSSHCELAVSFPWVCNLHGELAVSYSWDHQMTSPCSSSCELTVRVANSCKAHSKLTVWAHLVSSLWANWVSSKWANREMIQVNSLWVWC